MRKTLMLSIFAITILVLSLVQINSSLITPSENAKNNAKIENSKGIEITESGEWGLERVDFIHYAKPEGKGKPSKNTNTCYKLMGVKWKDTPIDYVINPSNSQGIPENFITNTLVDSIERWDQETTTELFNNLYGVNYLAEYGVQDYQNSIVFGNYPETNVIGVTSIWYTRRGKQIVEFDMLFNENYAWGDATIDPSKMDLENIATHELGHAVGLADLYTDSCSSVTMYGYSNYGETIKRTLEQADIDGLQSMYN